MNASQPAMGDVMNMSQFDNCMTILGTLFKRYGARVPAENQNETDSFEFERVERFCSETPAPTPTWLRFTEVTDLRRIIYGQISPPFVVITLIVNALVCLVLLKQHMRTSTNIILASMALADALTCVIPFPIFVYVFSMGYAQDDWVSCSFLTGYVWLLHYLPTITHTASVWLTVTLAAQRYMYVRANVFQSNLATECYRKTLFFIALVVVISIMFHIWWFLQYKYESISFPSLAHRGQLVDACVERLTIAQDYGYVYWWSRVFFIQTLPCLALVVLNILLLYKIRESSQTRKRLSVHNSNQDALLQAVQENRRTNVMLCTVVALFLAVEVPLAVIGVLNIFSIFTVESPTPTAKDYVVPILNLLLLISYPFNFVIYCTMSRKFRETFMSLVNKCFCTRRAQGHHYNAAVTTDNRTAHETVL